jgi:hypothetical protein
LEDKYSAIMRHAVMVTVKCNLRSRGICLAPALAAELMFFSCFVSG